MLFQVNQNMKDHSHLIGLVFLQATGGMPLIDLMATKNSGLKNRTHVRRSRRKHINGVLQTCNVPLHSVSEV